MGSPQYRQFYCTISESIHSLATHLWEWGYRTSRHLTHGWPLALRLFICTISFAIQDSCALMSSIWKKKMHNWVSHMNMGAHGLYSFVHDNWGCTFLLDYYRRVFITYAKKIRQTFAWATKIDGPVASISSLLNTYLFDEWRKRSRSEVLQFFRGPHTSQITVKEPKSERRSVKTRSKQKKEDENRPTGRFIIHNRAREKQGKDFRVGVIKSLDWRRSFSQFFVCCVSLTLIITFINFFFVY